LQRVVDRHDALRGSMSADGQQFCVASALHVPVGQQDLTALDAAARAAALADALRRSVETPFDLAQGPLLRAELLRLTTNECVLLIGTHHYCLRSRRRSAHARAVALPETAGCDASPSRQTGIS
jgi:hypothetical protein